VVLIGGARSWVRERRVRRKSAEAAYVERRRSGILEDINGSRPLAEIIEQITELVSFRLRGAPCWCQLADGTRFGNCPPRLSALRIVEEQIPTRSGPAAGIVLAAFDALTKSTPGESQVLTGAAALASVAIETRRLYSDLRHRSEFDQLTEIHNRFSFDKYIDLQIEEARQHGQTIGLIYIDLDKFKQVNDRYGHRVGDLYLQEVAQRMKKQLRSRDMLARLGGDEFSVLLSMVRTRAVAEDIVDRLNRCFDEPFIIEECAIYGSASVGLALYPDDGTTRDSLLSAADATMYLAKNSKKPADIPVAC
jgi:diguanylate cyclase (GGDEF)-like protein